MAGSSSLQRAPSVYSSTGSQTVSMAEHLPERVLHSRDCQTVVIKSCSAQSRREQGSQMARPDLYQDISQDRVVSSGRYTTAHELEQLWARKAVVIQCHFRVWVAKKRFAAVQQAHLAATTARLAEEARSAQLAADCRRREVLRRLQPRTRADFELIQVELEAWRSQETKKIKNAGLPRETELMALRHVLSKETKLLQTVEKLWRLAQALHRAQSVARQLRVMTSDQQWSTAGGAVAVQTLDITKARGYADLFRGLTCAPAMPDERLTLLLQVKFTVKQRDCPLTRELVRLIDREADLLGRGRNWKSMEGLRKRITGLFWEFLVNPLFNPAATACRPTGLSYAQHMLSNRVLLA